MRRVLTKRCLPLVTLLPVSVICCLLLVTYYLLPVVLVLVLVLVLAVLVLALALALAQLPLVPRATKYT